ncbi:MAG: aldehyde dehydrogenase family protein [Planctomycetota bacterium]|nr:aldehyde dehydrogenase family protein [Planctomycetota bacterium]
MSLKQVLHIIDGKETASVSGRTFESINPATGQPWASVAYGESEDVNRAVESGWRAFESGTWSRMPATDQAQRMRTVSRLIRERADYLAELETKDTGKPLTAAKGDILGAASVFEYFSQIPDHVLGTTSPSDPGYFTYSRREPYGVVGGIAPWNFPFMLVVWKTAGPLAVGNSVVLKMAEQTPVTTTEFAKICLEAGIPPGVVNVVHGDGETGAALAAHPRVPKITFTGSTEVGRSIIRSSADAIKSVHLELGGKSPNIIFADANLDQAMAGSLFTSFFNSGQICTTGSRLLVAEAIAEEFIEKFHQRAKKIVVGDPMQSNTQLGPLISQVQLQRVQNYVKVGKEAGARVLWEGTPTKIPGHDQGYFFQPTIFTQVHPDMRIAQEEIFGPVLSVMTFKDDEEAIRIANNTIYGLAATVWTTNLSRAFTMADRLDAGIVWTNCPHYLKWNVPLEGHRTSGLGEDLGLESIKTFTKLKVNYINYGGHQMNWG